MDNVLGSEWAVIIAMMVHLLLVPGTKVEESFNVQACHDLLYENINISNYDHLSFPGVVPRTFTGPLFIAAIAQPVRAVFYLFGIQKIWMLFVVRFILGFAVVFTFLKFARSVQRYFGYETALFLRLIVASQFHFMFYSSRPLPNTFAMIGVLMVYSRWLDGRWSSAVRWATAVTAVFRCELVLLFAPIFLQAMLSMKLPLFGRNGAVFDGVRTAVKVLAITIPIDSFLWGRILWPEAEVAWFNIFMNKSSEYGVLPFFWYFYSAIPRALSASLLLFPFGFLLDFRLREFVIPPLVFIGLYSLLPHKELRFIMYAFPLLNLPAAVFCARMYISRNKHWFRWLLGFGVCSHILINMCMSGMFLYASARSYPGGDALGYLQYTHRFDGNKPRTIHMDIMTCQTGVSRFFNLYDKWQYNKTEDLPLSELQKFDYLFVGSYSGNLKEIIETNYSSTHRTLFRVPTFNGINWRPFLFWPLRYPNLRFKDKLAVLMNKEIY